MTKTLLKWLYRLKNMIDQTTELDVNGQHNNVCNPHMRLGQ